MTDYFGALLRSIGRAPPPQAAAPAVALGADVVEVDVERVADPSLSGPPAMARQTASRSSLMRGETPGEVVPAASDRRDLPAALARPPVSPTLSRVEVVAEPPTASAPPDPAPPASAPDDRGRAVTRAALAWVAADSDSSGPMSDVAPPTTHPAVEQVTSNEPAAPLPQLESRRPVVSEAGPRPAVEAPASVAPGMAAAKTIVQSGPIYPRTFVTLDAQAASFAPRAESVEVTIGEIHVRVDAATPPTMAPAAPSAPPAAPARPLLERTPARSGLARRALRRL